MLPPHPHSHPHSRTRNGSHPHTSAMPPTPVNSCAVCRAAPDRCAHARSASRMRVARPPPPPSPRRRQRRRRRSRPPKGCAVRPFYLFWTHPLQHSACFRPPLRPVASYPFAPQCTHLLSRSARLHTRSAPLRAPALHPHSPSLSIKSGTSFAVMHNVAKSRMQTFQREASRDEIKKALLYSLPRLSPPGPQPVSSRPGLPISHVYPIHTTNTPLCPVCTPRLPSHPITPDPTPLTPTPIPPRPTLPHLSLLGPHRPRRPRMSWTASRSSSASKPLPHRPDN